MTGGFSQRRGFGGSRGLAPMRAPSPEVQGPNAGNWPVVRHGAKRKRRRGIRRWLASPTSTTRAPRTCGARPTHARQPPSPRGRDQGPGSLVGEHPLISRRLQTPICQRRPLASEDDVTAVRLKAAVRLAARRCHPEGCLGTLVWGNGPLRSSWCPFW